MVDPISSNNNPIPQIPPDIQNKINQLPPEIKALITEALESGSPESISQLLLELKAAILNIQSGNHEKSAIDEGQDELQMKEHPLMQKAHDLVDTNPKSETFNQNLQSILMDVHTSPEKAKGEIKAFVTSLENSNNLGSLKALMPDVANFIDNLSSGSDQT